MAAADFESYSAADDRAAELYYNDPLRWQRMSLANIAGAGIFCADRAIHDYARENLAPRLSTPAAGARPRPVAVPRPIPREAGFNHNFYSPIGGASFTKGSNLYACRRGVTFL